MLDSLSNIVFVPEWEKHAFQAGSLTSERVCLCCFEEHALAISFADKFVDKTFYISNVFNREVIASQLVSPQISILHTAWNSLGCFGSIVVEV